MRVFFLFTFLLIHCQCLAQPQWKFHIAFEDATGAKDTLWLIWDQNATTGMDSLLGEYYNFVEDSNFYCYIVQPSVIAHTTVLAYPFWADLGVYVEGLNYIPPVKLSWDTSLFYQNIPPPLGYVNYARIEGSSIYFTTDDKYVNMTIMEEYTIIDPVFPLSFLIQQDTELGVSPTGTSASFRIVPNPFNDKISIHSGSVNISTLSIISLSGKVLFTLDNVNTSSHVTVENLELLPPGLYILKLTDTLNNHYYEKFIKN